MAGDATLVKIGAAWVTFGTLAGNVGEVIDLGYTKGGVAFEMETASHEITVDQEGITPIAESLLGRRVTVTVPMAQSDYEKLQKIIPDSVYNGGLLEIASGVGADLMDYSDELVITAAADANDYIKIYKAAPVANIRATFTQDGERIWPVQFKGFIPEVGHAHAGYIMALHEAT